MNKLTMILIVFVFISIIIGIIIYLYYEKPLLEHQNIYVDLSIIAKDIDLNENIVVNYSIAQNDINNIIRNGTTVDLGFIIESVLINNTYFVFISSLEYYPSKIDLIINETKPYRVEFDLKKPKNLTIMKIGNFVVDDIITLKVKSEYWQNLKFCYKYSTHFIRINILNSNFTLIDRPINFELYDKCFATNLSLINSELEIPFEYKYFGGLSNNDYVKFVFFDDIFNHTYIYDINNI